MVCLAPRAPKEIVRPRRQTGVGARPLNFTVRGRSLTRTLAGFALPASRSHGVASDTV